MIAVDVAIAVAVVVVVGGGDAVLLPVFWLG